METILALVKSSRGIVIDIKPHVHDLHDIRYYIFFCPIMVYRTSPVVPDRISLGAHEFTARAINAAGIIGEDQFTWNVSNPSDAASGI
jgi:hypothetical protein